MGHILPIVAMAAARPRKTAVDIKLRLSSLLRSVTNFRAIQMGGLFGTFQFIAIEVFSTENRYSVDRIVRGI